MSVTTCPVFKPTAEEFSNFRGYIKKIEESLALENVGICKIIPPESWLADKGEYDMSTMPIVIENPIKQVVSGRAGVFNVDLLELKPMNIKDFADYDKKNSNNCGASDQERERKFWRSLGCPGAWDNPIYGADQIGTLFNSSEGGAWNVNNLDSIVNLLGPVPGVSSAYLYVGTWRSMFAYHVEDLDLYSINYLHAGAPKSWYSIKQKDKNRFESFAVSYFVEEHQQCHEFLRHKTKMFSPIKLKEYGIEYTTVLHNPGEFIITFPGAYHAGFNHGLNVAESTNFATTRWFDIGKRAKRCICRPHSVNINVLRLETIYLRNELQENRDVSMFHSNNDSDEDDEEGDERDTATRRYRCICATDGIVEVTCETPPSVRCSACSLWGHAACYEDETVPQGEMLPVDLSVSGDLMVSGALTVSDGLTVSMGESVSFKTSSVPPLCFMCAAIESELKESRESSMDFSDSASSCTALEGCGDGNEDMGAALERKKTKGTKSTKSPKAPKTPRGGSKGSPKGGEDSPIAVKSKQKAAEPSSKEKAVVKRKRKIAEKKVELTIGDVVSVQMDDSHTTIGIVTDIEDDLGRLHVKGTRKDLDVWIPLIDCLLIEKSHREKNKLLRQESLSGGSPSEGPDTPITETPTNGVPEVSVIAHGEPVAPSSSSSSSPSLSSPPLPALLIANSKAPHVDQNTIDVGGRDLSSIISRKIEKLEKIEKTVETEVTNTSANTPPQPILPIKIKGQKLNFKISNDTQMMPADSSWEGNLTTNSLKSNAILLTARTSTTPPPQAILGSKTSVAPRSLNENSVMRVAVPPSESPSSPSKILPPDHFFKSNTEKICVSLAAMTGEDLIDLKAWLTTAIVPLCSASLSPEVLTALLSTVRATCSHENEEFLDVIQSYGRVGKVSVIRSMAFRYLSLVMKCHPPLSPFVLNILRMSETNRWGR